MHARAFPVAIGLVAAALQLSLHEAVHATSPLAKRVGPPRAALVCIADSAVGEFSVCDLVAAELGLRTGLPVDRLEAGRTMPAATLLRIEVRAGRAGDNLEVSLFRRLPRQLGMGEGRKHSFALRLGADSPPRLRAAIAATLDHFVPPAPQALNQKPAVIRGGS
jgi:hypothetical protein